MIRRLAVLLALGLAQPALAQETPAILVVDQERLFQDSELGQVITEELEERSNALAAENRAIEADLIAEERDLTERRAELDPDEFRTLADEFDARVERLRDEQDAKARDLVALRDAERQRFTRTVGPILLEFMRQSGAAVVLDRRSVVATADRVDVTDELIEVIDDSVDPADTPLGEAPAAEAPAEMPPAEAPAGEAPAAVPEFGTPGSAVMPGQREATPEEPAEQTR